MKEEEEAVILFKQLFYGPDRPKWEQSRLN